MAIVQVQLDVQDDIYKGVLDGTIQLMGLAKDMNHKVRKHIPRAEIVKKDSAKVAKAGVIEVIKEHKVGLIVIGVAATVTGAGTFVYKKWKDNKKEKAEERIAGFKKSLQEYLEASRKGELNETVVDNLLYAIEEMDAKNLGKDIELLIPAKQLAELISSIFTYTEMLAKVNEYKAKVKRPKTGTNGNIVSLKQYLEIQKQILQESA